MTFNCNNRAYIELLLTVDILQFILRGILFCLLMAATWVVTLRVIFSYRSVKSLTCRVFAIFIYDLCIFTGMLIIPTITVTCLRSRTKRNSDKVNCY